MSRQVQETNFPIADHAVPAAIVAMHTPDMRQRLLVPSARLAGSEKTDQREERERLMTSRAPEALKRPKLSPLKQLGHYIAAFFKLGRTEWMAKHAFRSTEKIEPLVETALRTSDYALEIAQKAEDIASSATDIAYMTSERTDKATDLAKNALSKLDQFLQESHPKITYDLGILSHSIADLENAVKNQDHRFDTLKEVVEVYDSAAARAITDLGRRLDLMLVHRLLAGAADDSTRTTSTIVSREPEGFLAFCDQFYHRLQNRYRGSKTEIANRLRFYLPDVEAAVSRCNGKPVLDIGCGRGEWLALLKRAGVSAFGVDTNELQIDEGRREELDVRLGDAVEFLANAEGNSLSVITAHHLVEHLPFETVAWIVREATRVLAPGGLLLFETPDTRNLLVGATTFHTDPTHLKPMPEQVLEVLFETAGFHPINIRHLNPHDRLNEFLARPNFDDELAMLLFGPQDLAVIGVKPD